MLIVKNFQITDTACNGITCLNGGNCSSGQCICPRGWKNATCNVPEDACEKNGLQCGIWGNCVSGYCQCVADWSGEECQYPPKCNIRCSNGGMPNDPLMTLEPGNSWGCTYCQCFGNYQGDHCDECGVKCFNGGSILDNCGGCDCPTWYTGYNCEDKYWIASFKVDITPPNLDLSKPSDIPKFEQAVEDDLIASLPSGSYTVTTLGNTVTVWIAAGDQSIILRENLKRQIFGNNYWVGNQGVPFQSTLIGEKVILNSYQQRDPPSAGTLTTPSLLITLAIILVGLWMA